MVCDPCSELWSAVSKRNRCERQRRGRLEVPAEGVEWAVSDADKTCTLPPPSDPTTATTFNHPHAILFYPVLSRTRAYSAPATLLSNAGYTVGGSRQPLLKGLPEMGNLTTRHAEHSTSG
jgi:hypothetical protein